MSDILSPNTDHHILDAPDPEDALFEEMTRGGKGQCPKCLKVVHNVAYHMAHNCDIPAESTTDKEDKTGSADNG